MTTPPTDPSGPQTLRTPAGKLTYTDVGTGPPIVFLHGNPTSARLYRYLIRDLASDYRCVAPDYLGFGRSTAPTDFTYRPPAHATLIESLIRTLDLSRITLVLHDWGGPIGFSYALRHPATVRRLVLLNTWAWPLRHRPLLQSASRFFATPVGRIAVEHLNAFARVIIPLTTGPSSSCCPDWIRPYIDALATRPRRRACGTFARSLRAETRWLRALWTHRNRLRGRPALLCWGEADPAFGPEQCLRRWQNLFPDAVVRRFRDIGHYVPEEVGAPLAAPVRRFLNATPS